MDNFARASNSNRFVIDEDFVPKATSDGQPHEIMTLVASLSGLLAAVIVLSFLISLIGCSESERTLQAQPNQETNPVPNNDQQISSATNPVSIIPMFTRTNNNNKATTQLTSITILSYSKNHETSTNLTHINEKAHIG